MALLSPLVWEIRPTHGITNNGGAFDPSSGTPGTDYSQQDAAQITWLTSGGTYINDLSSVDGSSQITSAALAAANDVGFLPAHVGNIINITAGDYATLGRYQIISVSGGTATIDRDCASSASLTNGSGYLGGAVDSLNTIYGTVVAGNTIYLAATGHGDSIEADRSITAGTITSPVNIIGYTNAGSGAGTRTNLSGQTWAESHNAYGFLTGTNYPTLALAGRALTIGLNTRVSNLLVTSTLNATSIIPASCCTFWRVKVSSSGNGALAKSFQPSNRCTFIDCEVNMSGATSSACVLLGGSNIVFYACRFTSLAGYGINYSAFGPALISDCLFYDFATTAIVAGNLTDGSQVINSTFNNCLTCISAANSTATTPLLTLINNQVSNCTTFCTNLSTTSTPLRLCSYNNRIRDTTNPYTGWIDDPISESPSIGDILTDTDDATEYVSVANKDFHLNAAALGVGTGMPPSRDIGCWQRESIGGTTGKVRTLPLEI